jgi:hypothetical protein
VKEIVSLFQDPYERKARAFPGLLVVLPLLVAVGTTWGPRHPVLTSILGLLVSCGVIYTLASLVRDLGKAKEEALINKWGGMPTTLMLRHRDSTLEGGTKTIYHQLITQKLGIPMPTALEEGVNPEAADDAYRSAARALRGRTRGKEYSLLLKENTSYGFRRNMYGARRIGFLTSLLGIVVGVFLSGAISLQPLAFDALRLLDPPLHSVLTLGVSGALFFGWFFFGPTSVRRIGFAYAERLFETLGTLTTPRTSRKKSAASAM